MLLEKFHSFYKKHNYSATILILVSLQSINSSGESIEINPFMHFFSFVSIYYIQNIKIYVGQVCLSIYISFYLPINLYLGVHIYIYVCTYIYFYIIYFIYVYMYKYLIHMHAYITTHTSLFLLQNVQYYFHTPLSLESIKIQNC